MIVINKINNLLFFNVESLINGVSYGLTSYVYKFIFIKLNLVSLTKIFKIVIINWWRNQIYYTDSFNVFIIFFDIVVLLLDIKILILIHITGIWMAVFRSVLNGLGGQLL